MDLILIVALLCAVVYLANKYFFSFWTKLNVKQIEPNFFFGNAKEIFTFKKSMGEFFEETYKKTKNEKFIGGYLSYLPILIVNDPELIQDIMIRDFTTFHDRPTPADAAKRYPLVGNLFNLRGQKWRDLRIKLSPTFTSGKLKVMFPIMRDCGKVLQDYIAKEIKNGETIFEFKDLCSRFTINNISSIAFGVENDCINEPDNIFRKMGLKMFEPSFRNGIVNMLAFFTPKLFTLSRMKPFPADVEDFIYSLVNQTVEYREKNNFHRNDFMQLMIQLKNQGYISADKDVKDDEENEDEWKNENTHGKVTKLNIDELAAQAFIFFGAGYETSSSTMSFALFELARNQDVLRKAQEEIDRVMKTSDSNGLTYELLQQMKYLDCIVDETLRIHPIVPMLFRVGTKDYQIPNTDVIIPKDTAVFMPIIGIQRDPEIYDEPMKFKPERFLDSPNGNGKAKGAIYIPFGTGSRNCIGARLGKIQSKLGLATVLAKFNFELHDKSLATEELKYHPNSIVMTPLKPIKLKVTLR